MVENKRINKIKKIISRRQEGIVVLENIHDPHNAMAVCRTAEGLGFQKIYFIKDEKEVFDPKVLGKSSSSSANKWLSFKFFNNTKICFEELKKEGFTIIATVVDKEAKAINKTDFKRKKIAIVLGNEHGGLSKAAIEAADEKIYIPMKGMVQSFNLSVTAAIVLYEIDRQRGGKSKYRLTDK